MKTKKKPVSIYQKTESRMKQEVGRALAQVKFLEKMYEEMRKKKNG